MNKALLATISTLAFLAYGTSYAQEVIKPAIIPAAAPETPKETAPTTPTTAPSPDEVIYRTNLGRADDVALLIKQGASVDQTNGSGVPLIALAASRNDAEGLKIMEMLAEAGADINKTDNRGQNALFYAAKNGNNDAVDFLLKRGIRYAASDKNGNNARNIAFQTGHNNIVEMMDNFVRGQNDEMRKQYEEANKELEERYKAYNESVAREAAENEAAGKKADPAGKTPQQLLEEQIKQSVRDIAFASCAASYWTYCNDAKQPTELGANGLKANIDAQKNRAIELSAKFIKEYKVGVSVPQKIVMVSKSQIVSQLNNFPSNSARRDRGVGTLDDMNRRCTEIAQIWNKTKPAPEKTK